MKNPRFLISLLFLLLLQACGPEPEHGHEHGAEIPAGNGYVVPDGPHLVILGVAQDAGYPQIDCKKDCCKPAWKNPDNGKMVSCIGLADPRSGKKWIFDATPDFRVQLSKLNGGGAGLVPDGVFLTHAHIGHYTGLMYLGRESMNADSVPVYAMPGMQKFLESSGPWSLLNDLGNISIQSMQNDSMVALEKDINVTPILVPHRDEFSETVGFRIKGPLKSALFIPDIDKWNRWPRNIKDEIAKVDYALLDGTFFANGEIPGRDMSEIPHPFVEESMELLKDLPAKEKHKVIFIHFNHSNPLIDPTGEAAQQVKAAGFRVAEEGMVLEL